MAVLGARGTEEQHADPQADVQSCAVMRWLSANSLVWNPGISCMSASHKAPPLRHAGTREVPCSTACDRNYRHHGVQNCIMPGQGIGLRASSLA